VLVHVLSLERISANTELCLLAWCFAKFTRKMFFQSIFADTDTQAHVQCNWLVKDRVGSKGIGPSNRYLCVFESALKFGLIIMVLVLQWRWLWWLSLTLASKDILQWVKRRDHGGTLLYTSCDNTVLCSVYESFVGPQCLHFNMTAKYKHENHTRTLPSLQNLVRQRIWCFCFKVCGMSYRAGPR